MFTMVSIATIKLNNQAVEEHISECKVGLFCSISEACPFYIYNLVGKHFTESHVFLDP